MLDSYNLYVWLIQLVWVTHTTDDDKTKVYAFVMRTCCLFFSSILSPTYIVNFFNSFLLRKLYDKVMKGNDKNIDDEMFIVDVYGWCFVSIHVC